MHLREIMRIVCVVALTILASSCGSDQGEESVVNSDPGIDRGSGGGDSGSECGEIPDEGCGCTEGCGTGCESACGCGASEGNGSKSDGPPRSASSSGRDTSVLHGDELTSPKRDDPKVHEQLVFFATTRADQGEQITNLAIYGIGLLIAVLGLIFISSEITRMQHARWIPRTLWCLLFFGSAYWIWRFWGRGFAHYPALYGCVLLSLALLPPILRVVVKPEYKSLITAYHCIAIGGAVFAAYAAVVPEVRELRAFGNLERNYGPHRGEYDDPTGCEFGSAVVTIPNHRKLGQVNVPRLYDLVFDPVRHFMIKDGGLQTVGSFEAFRDRIQAERTDDDAFLFIHGYNNTFRSALFRTAQIAHDIGYTGTPILFSWPTRGKPLAYSRDEASVGAAAIALSKFLVAMRPTVKGRFVVVAHSMGCRVLGRALVNIAANQHELGAIDAVILAAPDINEETYRQEIAPRLLDVSKLCTMYVSSHDGALKLSRGVHGDQRAGAVDQHPIVVPGIDTIDVSLVSRGHSYIGGNSRVIRDFRNLIQTFVPAKVRLGLAQFVKERGYYRLIHR